MAILVTGGAGYIGSHTCIEMLGAGYDVVVIDNLDNSSSESLERVQKISGRTLKFYEKDVRDREALREIFKENDIEAVIHFAKKERHFRKNIRKKSRLPTILE